MESLDKIMEFIFHPAIMGGLCFVIVLKTLVNFHKDEKGKSYNHKAAIEAMLFIIMFSLFIIISKL